MIMERLKCDRGVAAVEYAILLTVFGIIAVAATERFVSGTSDAYNATIVDVPVLGGTAGTATKTPATGPSTQWQSAFLASRGGVSSFAWDSTLWGYAPVYYSSAADAIANFNTNNMTNSGYATSTPSRNNCLGLSKCNFSFEDGSLSYFDQGSFPRYFDSVQSCSTSPIICPEGATSFITRGAVYGTLSEISDAQVQAYAKETADLVRSVQGVRPDGTVGYLTPIDLQYRSFYDANGQVISTNYATGIVQETVMSRGGI